MLTNKLHFIDILKIFLNKTLSKPQKSTGLIPDDDNPVKYFF